MSKYNLRAELQADEIEVRLQKEYPWGAKLLLYKNARVDMAVLDEAVGIENWQRKHYECKGNLFCSVGIRFGDDWVWKDDAGAESRTEKEKGEASDSFKRACTNWGIGRALYTSPNITVKDYYKNDGKFADYMTVSEIGYTDGKISMLKIKNKSGNICFTYGKNSKCTQKEENPPLVACPICHHAIKPVKKDGRTVTPQEIMESCGGMCIDCYKASQAKEKEV